MFRKNTILKIILFLGIAILSMWFCSKSYGDTLTRDGPNHDFTIISGNTNYVGHIYCICPNAWVSSDIRLVREAHVYSDRVVSNNYPEGISINDPRSTRLN